MNRIVMQTLVAIFVGCVLAGCAATRETAPVPAYQNRAVTRTEGGMQVSTAVLSPQESAAVYGVALADKRIQPVWIEVENHEDRSYYLLSPGLDPNFFPAWRQPKRLPTPLRRNSGPNSTAAFARLPFITLCGPERKSPGSC